MAERAPQILIPEIAIAADSNYNCAVCPPSKFGFQEHPCVRRLFKFPSAIGSQGAAPMAFVGLNPRISNTNRALYYAITIDPEAYISLAGNRAPDGQPYVRLQGGERHYHTHAKVVREAVRGTQYDGKSFEEVAVCTELFMCATPPRQTAALTKALKAPSPVCPDLHFWKAIQRAAPKVLVTLGDDVFDYVSTFATHDGSVYRLNMAGAAAMIIAIPHPGGKLLTNTQLTQVADACREVLLGRSPTAWDFRRSTTSSPGPTTSAPPDRDYEWTDRYGWQVDHRPADLAWLQTDPKRTITYRLHRGGKLRYKMILDGQQLRQAISWRGWPEKRYVNPVTKKRHRRPIEEFLPQWAKYVKPVS